MFGKKQRKKAIDGPLKMKSIFFELPYWEHNTCHHNLDVMHTEKNIYDNIIGTLLDITRKTKDHLNAHLDLVDMGIKKNLHPRESNDSKKIVLAKASFSMTTEEKYIFCNVLKGAKLPDSSASNISRCVHVIERIFRL